MAKFTYGRRLTIGYHTKLQAKDTLLFTHCIKHINTILNVKNLVSVLADCASITQ